jgi:hypothetical protein
MIEIHLTDQEIQDLNEAIDDPSHSEKTKIKLLVIRMRPRNFLSVKSSD